MKRCLSFRFGLVCMLLAFTGAFPAFGQSEATLRVVVTSAEDGSPLQGTHVVLKSPIDEETVQAGATNRDGHYAMRGLSPGRYLLEISYIGFETHRDTLDLQAGRRVYSVSLSLKPGELDEVTVESERGAAQREAGLQTIRTAEIDRIPTPGPSGDLASYLQTLPGVVSVGDRGGQLYIRGGAPTQNRFLLDGLPVVQPFHISSAYSAFPQDAIQSVDLYSGGFGAEYGEAISGVLDVRLRPGNMKRYDGSAAVGPNLASLSAEGPIVRNTQSFFLSARYSLVEETAGPLFGRDVPLGFYDAIGRYSYQQENTSCNVTALRTGDRGSLGPDQEREFTWSNTTVGGRCLILEEQFDHTFSMRGGYSGFQNSAGTAGSPEEKAGRWRGFLALTGEQTIGGHPVNFGGRVTAGKYWAEIDEQFVGVEQLNASQWMVRAHWSMDWAPNDYVSVTPSLAARVTAPVRPSVDPRLRLSLNPNGTDRHEISVSAGLYHQIDEGITDQRNAGTVFTVWRPPNRNDPLPRALHGILGYRWRLGTSLEASVEGYAKRLQNIPVSKWTPEAAINTEIALAHGIAYGADARVEFQRAPIYAYLGYGWSKVTYEAATEDLGAWVSGELFSYSPSHDRRHQLNALASYEVMGVTATVNWEFGSGRPYTKVYGFDLALEPPNQRPTEHPGTAHTIYERPYGARLPVYHRLDVSAERSFDLSARLGLDVEVGAINVYDRRNIFYYDVNRLQRVDQSPLLPYVSLKLNLE